MPAIVQTNDLAKEFAGYRAMDGVSIAVEEGSIHAIIGPNGAGKTTLFNLLSGLTRPTRGSIHLRGSDITGFSAAAIARMGMIRSFQINSIFPHLTVLDNVKVSLQALTDLPKKFWAGASATRHLEPRARELLAEVGLRGHDESLAAQLSYGRKRQLELALSLAQDPQLLLLDEPTAGMTVEDVGRVTKLIGRVAKGRTVVLVEHNLSVVADLCDRITVLQRGKVLVEGTYAEVRADRRVVDAYLGGHA
jgi:branched-chain amino acid transport system ATP-binding protein